MWVCPHTLLFELFLYFCGVEKILKVKIMADKKKTEEKKELVEETKKSEKSISPAGKMYRKMQAEPICTILDMRAVLK